MKFLLLASCFVLTSVAFAKEVEELYPCKYDHRIFDATSYNFNCKVKLNKKGEEVSRSCKSDWKNGRTSKSGSIPLNLVSSEENKEVYEGTDMKVTLNLKNETAKMKKGSHKLTCTKYEAPVAEESEESAE